MSSLQVWHGEKLVGHIAGNFQQCGGHIELRQIFQEIDFNGGVFLEDVVHLPTFERCYEMDRFTMELAARSDIDRELAESGVPPNCPYDKLPQKDSVRYHWLAADVSTELYERLFDFDAFEPEAINGPDPDDERLRSQLHSGGYGSAPPPSVFTPGSGGVGGSTYVSALGNGGGGSGGGGGGGGGGRRLSSGQKIMPGPWSYYAGIAILRPEHGLLNITLT